jgi:hypothetical protein
MFMSPLRSASKQTEPQLNKMPRLRRRSVGARLGASCLLAAAVESTLCAQRATAVTHTFTGGIGGFSGAWSLAGNWNPGGVPGSGDTAIIGFVSSTMDTNVTYDYPGPAVTLSALRVSRANAGIFNLFSNLNMAANTLTASDEFVGDTSVGGSKGRGSIDQSGGNNTTQFLELGVNASDFGNYSLSNTGVFHANTLDVALSGGANFSQSGGIAQCTTVDLAGLGGSNGTYTISGGVLAADGTIFVGDESNGTFNQSGGTVAPDIGSMSTVIVGNFGGSSGTYNLSGGTLSATTLNIGSFGTGTFLQSAGSVLLNAFGATPASLPLAAFNNAMYSLGNVGAVTVTGGSEIIGDTANGTFIQSGGVHSISFGTFASQAAMTLGNASFSNGTYALGGGTLSITNGNEVVGFHGTGTFTQTGGTNTMNPGYLVLGQASGSAGYYTISDGALSANFIGVGMSQGGPGQFNQDGGTVTCQTLGIANNTNDARGSYTITAGSLTMGSGTETTAAIYVSAGIGTFTQSGGTVAPAAGVDLSLYIGSEVGANGAYILNDGTLSVPLGREFIGSDGNGTFNQNGGTHSLGTASLTIGAFNGSNGTYNLSSGTLALNGGAEYVGSNGAGTFHQTGGTHKLTFASPGGDGLYLGFGTLAHGSYTLDAGSLTVTNGGEFIGFQGMGTFNQTGGMNTLSASDGADGLLGLGEIASSRGVYNLSGGTLNLQNLFIDSGTFNQSAGAVNLTGVAGFPIGPGSAYNLSGGTLTSFEGRIYVGNNTAGTGTFNQTGGANILNGNTFAFIGVGRGAGQNGIYNLDAGTLSALSIYVGGDNTGPGGSGTFNLNTTNTLTLRSAMTVYSTGTLAGSGATNGFIVNNGAISPGNGGPGTLTVGPLILNAGSRLYFEPGDLLSSTNGINITGSTRVALNGPFTDPAAIITYAISAAGANNLSIAGNMVGLTYSVRNDTAGHTVLAIPSRVATDTQISVNGQLGPIGQTFIPGVSPGAINDSATVSFEPDLSSGNYGPVLFDGHSFVPVALTGQPAPGAGGGTFNGTLNYRDDINSLGQTVFISFLAGTSDGSTEGCFRGSGSSLVAIYRDQQVLPNGGGTITGWFSAPVVNSINNAGQVPVLVGLSGASDGAASEIFIGDGNSLIPIARNKQAAPGAGGGVFDASFGPFGGSHTDPIINNAGQVAFHATLAGTSDGSTAGVFRGDANSIIAIARTGQTSPGSGGGTFSGFGFGLALNDLGQVAFQSNLAGASDAANSALYRGDGISTVVIARDKQSAPGAGGGSFSGNGFFGFGSPIAMSASGQVAFQVNLSGTSDGSTSGIFRGDGNSIVAIARQKQIAPNTAGATINDFGNTGLTIARGGQVAFIGSLANTIDGNAGKALFVGDGQDLIPVAITAQTVATSQGNRTIGSNISFGVFNSYGQLPWSALFSAVGLDSGNFLFTPVLHWRAPGSGNWDNITNWTLGLAPAYVHDVIVDPTSPLTITGPSSNTTIKSFTVGTLGSGAATVRLSTGNLRVTGPLSITGPSKLDLDGHDLVYGYTGAVLPLNLIRADLLLGYAGGTWLGGGITSSHAADPSNIHKTALGYAAAGAIGRSSFDGFTVAPSDVLVKYTLSGDANLDGAVNTVDFNMLAARFNGATGLWSDGDFNFDGVSNALDFNAVATNFGQTLSSPPLASIVPEPTLSIFALILLLARRRRV